MMMLLLSIIIFAVVVVSIYFFEKSRQSSAVNQYRQSKSAAPFKESSKLEPVLENHYSEMDDTMDEIDSPLGIKNTDAQSEAIPVSVASKSVSNQPDCVVVLCLVASEKSIYRGYELLQALLSAGLRFGKHHIFHRHMHKDGRGDILFHCASAIAPGTFDLSKMGSFSCEGLSLFFSASAVEEPLATFDCLLETIDLLIEDLGGRVLDEHRVLFTKDRMVKYRQQLRIYEAGKITTDLFEEV